MKEDEPILQHLHPVLQFLVVPAILQVFLKFYKILENLLAIVTGSSSSVFERVQKSFIIKTT